MSDQVKLSPEAQKALQDQTVKTKIEELANLSRLIVNTLNLLCSNDIQIPSAYAQPVAEVQVWLQGMHKNIDSQLSTLKALLPVDEATKTPINEVKPEVVAVVDAGTAKAIPLAVAPDQA